MVNVAMATKIIMKRVVTNELRSMRLIRPSLLYVDSMLKLFQRLRRPHLPEMLVKSRLVRTQCLCEILDTLIPELQLLQSLRQLVTSRSFGFQKCFQKNHHDSAINFVILRPIWLLDCQLRDFFVISFSRITLILKNSDAN